MLQHFSSSTRLLLYHPRFCEYSGSLDRFSNSQRNFVRFQERKQVLHLQDLLSSRAAQDYLSISFCRHAALFGDGARAPRPDRTRAGEPTGS